MASVILPNSSRHHFGVFWVMILWLCTLHVRFSWRVLCVCSLLDKRYRRMLWLHHAQVCILISATMYTMLIVEATWRFAIVIELPINDTMYIYSTWWGFKSLMIAFLTTHPFHRWLSPSKLSGYLTGEWIGVILMAGLRIVVQIFSAILLYLADCWIHLCIFTYLA